MSSVFLGCKVVKINMKKLIIGIMFLMLVVPMAYAGTGKLLIEKLDVEVDGKWSRNVEDGETISREAEPGSTVKFKIKFKNNYTDAEDLKIEDITATVTIEEIDDGDDLDEESSEFDVREDDDKTVSVEFDIPIEVDEDTFDVTIEAEGEDENGTDQSVTWTVSLELEKETHELRFYRNTLSPSEVKCGATTSFNLGIINTGSDDQEDVELTISNSDLEYSTLVTISEIEAEPFEDECRYSKIFKINVPRTAEAGIYPIDFKATYDDGDELIEDSVDLTVTECKEEEEVVPPEDEDEEDVVVVTPPVVTPPVITPPVVTPPVTSTEEEKSFFESGWFVGLLIGAELLIIIIAIVLVVTLVKRRS